MTKKTALFLSLTACVALAGACGVFYFTTRHGHKASIRGKQLGS